MTPAGRTVKTPETGSAHDPGRTLTSRPDGTAPRPV